MIASSGLTPESEGCSPRSDIKSIAGKGSGQCTVKTSSSNNNKALKLSQKRELHDPLKKDMKQSRPKEITELHPGVLVLDNPPHINADDHCAKQLVGLPGDSSNVVIIEKNNDGVMNKSDSLLAPGDPSDGHIISNENPKVLKKGKDVKPSAEIQGNGNIKPRESKSVNNGLSTSKVTSEAKEHRIKMVKKQHSTRTTPRREQLGGQVLLEHIPQDLSPVSSLVDVAVVS